MTNSLAPRFEIVNSFLRISESYFSTFFDFFLNKNDKLLIQKYISSLGKRPQETLYLELVSAL